MENKKYFIGTELKGEFNEVLKRVKDSFQEQGFGILTEIDVKKTLKEKLGKDHSDYVILGICNPSFAYKLISAEKDVGLALPCNVIVYESIVEGDKKIIVKAMNPETALGIFESDKLEEIDCEAREKIIEAIKNLNIEKERVR